MLLRRLMVPRPFSQEVRRAVFPFVLSRRPVRRTTVAAAGESTQRPFERQEKAVIDVVIWSDIV